MHRLPTTILVLSLFTGCDSQPKTPEEVRRIEWPQVINRRPDFPADKAVLHVQAQTLFFRHDADLGEAWSLVGDDGIKPDRARLLEANAIRIGTMDAVTVGQFYDKLPRRNGGTKLQTIGVGREPVIFETTPTLDRAVEIQALLGADRDETLRLPAGRMQLLIDVVLGVEKVTASLTPHHHWVSTMLTPRSPEEKAMDGRVFKELSVEVDVTGDRYLVISWLAPVKKEVKPEPVEDPPVVGGGAPPLATEPPRTERPETPPVLAPPAPSTPRKLKLGDLLLTGFRAERPLQMICIIRIPPQGESIPSPQFRPD